MPAESGRREELARRLAFQKAEDRMAPREFLDWAKGQGENDPYGTRADLRRFWFLQPFQRTEIAAGGSFYQGRGKAKGLIVAFGTKAHRLGVPTPAFLQRVAARDWDMLMLRDLALSHYRHGCVGIAGDFPGLVRWLREFAGGYERLVLIGASLGAGAAVRMSIALGGVQVVVFGARPAMDIDRLFRERQAGLAFDPLCACLPQVERDITYVFAGRYGRDQKGARTFQAVTGGHLLPVPGLAQHGVTGPMWQSGQLGAFLRVLLSGRQTPESRLRKWRKIVQKVGLTDPKG